MKLELQAGTDTTVVDLADGCFTVGGGQHDDVRYDGLPVKLLTLTVDGPRLTIKARRPLRVGAHLFPAAVSRMVLPGELLRLPNDVVLRRPDDEAAKERRRAKGTDLLARELLASTELSQLESRAASVTCVAGPDEGLVFPLAYLDTMLGRGDDADVRLHDRTVSRSHARLLLKGPTYVVEDVAKTNGVYVNGKRLTRPQALVAGDVIELGHSVLRFDAGEPAPEERTNIEPLPFPPPSVEVAVEPAPVELQAQPRWDREALTVGVLGAAIVVTGLATALLFG